MSRYIGIPEDLSEEIRREAARTGQSPSNLAQVAWFLARAEIKKFDPKPKKRHKRARKRWPRWTE